jgi:sugar/nucleoside kinase (ribokinase family)
MQRDTEVVCGGILVADHVCTPMDALPEEGHLVAVESMLLLTGGCAANVGVNIAKQGVSVSLMGKVGDDYFGRFVREDLAERGLDTAGVQVSAKEQTSQTMILLCKGQDRRFVHTFGANRDFHATDVDRDVLRRARVFYLGGYLVLPDLAPEALAELFRFCRENDVRTVLDVVVPSGFQYSGELEPVLPYTDVFLPNDDEAQMLTGSEAPVEQAEALRAMGAGTVLVTMGDEGLVYTSAEGTWRAGHFDSDVVDQTGSGDAFCAGFITGMIRGRDLHGCVDYGSALGASCVRSIGCYEGVFKGDQAQDFLARHSLKKEPAS